MLRFWGKLESLSLGVGPVIELVVHTVQLFSDVGQKNSTDNQISVLTVSSVPVRAVSGTSLDL